MKKIRYLLMTTALVLGTAACQRELTVDSEPEPDYASIASDLGRDAEGVDGAAGTKSVVSVEVENFHKAILFAFNPSTGKVLTYGANAPASLRGKPVTIETTETSFVWHLPLKTPMTIYALANYGSLDMSAYTSKGADLTKADLDALTFSCTSSTELQKLESQGYGLPMSGTLSVSASDITAGTETLAVTLKKLFARYNLYLDLSDLAATHASVVTEHAMIYNMNTSVHYFGSGDKSTTSRISSAYDRATDSQLEILQKGGNSNQVTFYVLENLQGNIPGATNWSTVYGEIGANQLEYCTFLSLSVLLTDDNGRAETRNYRIYLGKTDMKSNFDVLRNYSKTIRLKVTEIIEIPPIPGNGTFFTFTNSSYVQDNSVVALAPGESVTLYFKTDLNKSDILFSFKNADNGSSISYLTASDITLSSGLGSVKITASSSANVGTKVKVQGGTAEVSDIRRVEILEPVCLLSASSAILPVTLSLPVNFETNTDMSNLEFRLLDSVAGISCDIRAAGNIVDVKSTSATPVDTDVVIGVYYKPSNKQLDRIVLHTAGLCSWNSDSWIIPRENVIAQVPFSALTGVPASFYKCTLSSTTTGSYTVGKIVVNEDRTGYVEISSGVPNVEIVPSSKVTATLSVTVASGSPYSTDIELTNPYVSNPATEVSKIEFGIAPLQVSVESSNHMYLDGGHTVVSQGTSTLFAYYKDGHRESLGTFSTLVQNPSVCSIDKDYGNYGNSTFPVALVRTSSTTQKIVYRGAGYCRLIFKYTVNGRSHQCYLPVSVTWSN